jgi:hypothetical protein
LFSLTAVGLSDEGILIFHEEGTELKKYFRL